VDSTEHFLKRVSVYEVGPRDGLQNEAKLLPAADKVRLIHALLDAGMKRIEATSFVSPKWIPQVADASDVMAKVERRPGVIYSALVPNLKGLERAIAARIDEACVFLSVTEGHSKKNINKTVAEGIATAKETAAAARKAGMQVRAYLSCVWGCPYQGKVTTAEVVNVVKQMLDIDMVELALGDTIGVGTPDQTAEILDALFELMPKEKLALHLHDTRGTALANALVGLQKGITRFDASSGGLGGCPYAPGAAGNLATEDLVYMLHGMNRETGIDFDKLIAAGELAQTLIGRKLPGKTLQAVLGTREKERSARR
jgi:hydroxymethylglutaryl-CoA lyase